MEHNHCHVLLTVLGRDPQEACYRLGDRQAEARLAPLALLDLLPNTERPDRVVALCTREAKEESWPLLEHAIASLYVVDPIDVPAGHAQKDIDTFLERVSQAIPADREVDLTVDVTHGYRHFSFLTYTAVLYLTALRGVRVRGAYYGLLRQNKVSPFLDLRPLLALPRWFHALQVLRETGSASPIAALLADGPQSPSARSISRDLSLISEAYLSGLPIELGQQVRGFCEQRPKPLKKLLRNDHHLPLAAELVRGLTSTLDPFQLVGQVSGNGWKRKTVLSRVELERQARLIDDLLDHESLATALGLMNEWAVSWVAWRVEDTGAWLDYKAVRRRAAGLLGAFAAVGSDPDLDPILSDDQRALGGFWSQLCELRNAYHHHGMRPQVLVGNGQIDRKLKDVQSYWRETLSRLPDLPLTLGSARVGRVLVSPIGRRPGVLFSALRVAQAKDQEAPAACLVICSRETEELIDEAVRHAAYDGPIESLVLGDPYGGRAEIERVVKMARKSLIGADEVFVNVTGGTTLMGLTAEAVASAARGLACPVRRFGLIDRRPPVQQDSDPYQAGEPFWLDAGEGGDVDRD
jgi:hypothetical protein